MSSEPEVLPSLPPPAMDGDVAGPTGDVMISAEGLGKEYTLGAGGAAYRTLRESLSPSSWGKKEKAQPFQALSDVSFEVRRGEVVGLIGRNGAGKSTLLKILARITEPTSGRAEIRGRVGSLLEVGTGFHPELTGRENVLLNGAVMGMRRTEILDRFDEIVAFAEVEEFLDTPVKRYSSGMQMRLAFAVAAHLDPEVLLVDEVLAVGDAAFRKKCLGRMSDIGGEGRTIIFVSHDMGALQRLCDRAILLDGGRITHSGPTSDVVGRYLAMAHRSEWHNPDEVEGPVSVRSLVASQGNQLAPSVFATNDPIQIAVDYVVTEPVNDLLLGFDLVSPEGHRLSRTYDLELAPEYRGVRRAGDWTSVLEIPADRLRPGSYTLELVVGLHQRRWITRNKVTIGLETRDDNPLGITRPGPFGAPGSWTISGPGLG